MTECERCGSDSRVVDSRSFEGNQVRRRKCVSCGHDWHTAEYAAPFTMITRLENHLKTTRKKAEQRKRYGSEQPEGFDGRRRERGSNGGLRDGDNGQGLESCSGEEPEDRDIGLRQSGG